MDRFERGTALECPVSQVGHRVRQRDRGKFVTPGKAIDFHNALSLPCCRHFQVTSYRRVSCKQDGCLPVIVIYEYKELFTAQPRNGLALTSCITGTIRSCVGLGVNPYSGCI